MADTAAEVAVHRRRPPHRRRTFAALAAVLLVAAALAMILILGDVRPPTFPSLLTSPDPSIPGRIAFTTPSRGADSTCLEVIDAGGGEPTRLHCVEDLFATDVTWTGPQQVLLRGHDQVGELALTVDASSGRVVERQRLRPDERPEERPEPIGHGGHGGHGEHGEPGDERADGAYVVTAGFGAAGNGDAGTTSVVLVEPDGSERILVEVDAGRGYAFSCAEFSPDGRWVLVRDAADRLLVVDAGAGGARVLVTSAATAAWQPEA